MDLELYECFGIQIWKHYVVMVLVVTGGGSGGCWRPTVVVAVVVVVTESGGGGDSITGSGIRKSRGRFATFGDAIPPQYAIQVLDELKGGNASITTGVGQHQMWAAHYYKYNKP
uniref:Uncharacterized protein n=1 Tax=Lactuca sativa TaxID=4236 RepID=A0A9R1XT31_LACSA|nr:hypothetical protein LSAT_V11C100012380 [Lactuca sativa]